jgi:hypothetical protein
LHGTFVWGTGRLTKPNPRFAARADIAPTGTVIQDSQWTNTLNTWQDDVRDAAATCRNGLLPALR